MLRLLLLEIEQHTGKDLYYAVMKIRNQYIKRLECWTLYRDTPVSSDFILSEAHANIMQDVRYNLERLRNAQTNTG